MKKSDSKLNKLAGGFAAMFQPTAPAPVSAPEPAVRTVQAKPEKPRQRAAVQVAPATPAAIVPAAPDPAEASGGKLVACFKWKDGAKASAARSAAVSPDASAFITYKGATGRLPGMIPEATRAEFIAHCEAAARKSEAALHYINAKGGRARKHDREGKRPSEIGIMDGWQRYSVTIRKTHYAEIERMREAHGMSHKDIVDSALSKELERMKAEIGTRKGNPK